MLNYNNFFHAVMQLHNLMIQEVKFISFFKK